jgi:hypothetical protein
MPNSYTAVPSIIPGNLTVNGNMNATGNVTSGIAVKGLQIQQTTDAAVQRMSTSAIGGSAFSVNMLTDGASRDVGTKSAWAMAFDPAAGTLKHRLINAAGGAMDMASRLTVAAVGSQITTTGIVASIAQYGATMRANVMGAHGGLRMRAVFTVNALVSASIPLNIQLGGVTIVSVALNATGLWAIEALVLNQALTNSQRGVLWVYRNGVAPALSVGTSAVDTTADQAFQAVAVMGNVGDSITANHGETEFLNTFGPV